MPPELPESSRPSKLPLIIGGIVGLLALGFVAVLLWPTAPAPEPAPTPSLPSAGSDGVTTAPAGMAVHGKLGPIRVKDFIRNGETEPDPQKPGIYILAGSSGYCLTDGTCPGGYETQDFYIVYDAQTQFFTITLYAEPLSKARAAAEVFLQERLGVNSEQMWPLFFFARAAIFF